MMHRLKLFVFYNFAFSLGVFSLYILLCLISRVDIDGRLGVSGHRIPGRALWPFIAFFEYSLLFIGMTRHFEGVHITPLDRLGHLTFGLIIGFLSVGLIVKHSLGVYDCYLVCYLAASDIAYGLLGAAKSEGG